MKWMVIPTPYFTELVGITVDCRSKWPVLLLTRRKVLGVAVAWYRDGHLSFLQASWEPEKRHLTQSLFLPREFTIGSLGFPAHCCPENFSCFRHVSN